MTRAEIPESIPIFAFLHNFFSLPFDKTAKIMAKDPKRKANQKKLKKEENKPNIPRVLAYLENEFPNIKITIVLKRYHKYIIFTFNIQMKSF